MFEVDTQSLLRVLHSIGGKAKKTEGAARDVVLFKAEGGLLHISYFTNSHGFKTQLPVEGEALAEFAFDPIAAISYFSLKEKGSSIVKVTGDEVEICQVDGDSAGAFRLVVRSLPFSTFETTASLESVYSDSFSSTATINESYFKKILALALFFPAREKYPSATTCLNLEVRDGHLNVWAGGGKTFLESPVEARTDRGERCNSAWLSIESTTALARYLEDSDGTADDVLLVQVGERSVIFTNVVGSFYVRPCWIGTDGNAPAPDLRSIVVSARKDEPAIVRLQKEGFLTVLKAIDGSGKKQAVVDKEEGRKKKAIHSKVIAIDISNSNGVSVIHYGEKDSSLRIAAEVPSSVIQPENKIPYLGLEMEQVCKVLKKVPAKEIVFHVRTLRGPVEISYPGQPEGEIFIVMGYPSLYYEELLKNA